MIPVDRLVASAFGELSGDADLAVEEHVLSCSRCAARYESLLRLGPAIADLVRQGGVTMPASPALVERLEAERLITRRYTLESGKPVPCSVGPDDIYALSTYSVDPLGVSRIDLIRGGERVPDVPFDAAGRVYLVTSADALRKLPTMRLQLRLLAVDDAGERILGDYVLEHTAPEI
jgi:hypothetical protein